MSAANREENGASRTRIQSLERGLAVLEVLSRDMKPMSVMDICKEVGVQRTTLYALLNTLISRGYVAKNEETSKYYITGKIYELGMFYPEKQPLVAYGRRYVDILSRKYNLVARIAYINSEKNAIVAYTSSKSVEFAKLEYNMVPSHASSVGKMILAHLPVEEQERRLETMELTRFTEHTITDIGKLREVLELIRQRGYSLDECEYMDNTFCVSFPIYDRNNSLCGILSTSDEYNHMKLILDDFVREGLQASKRISSDLGWSMYK